MTTTLAPGDNAPDFTLSDHAGNSVTLSALRGSPVVLYVYPKDDTPGCTRESCDFRDNMGVLQKHGVRVFGLSKDSVKSHQKFVEKYELNFPLLSDPDAKTIAAYGAWVEKSMYGKKYMGIDRSTFLIDADGKIAHIWRSVKVDGHVTDVLDALKKLKKAA
jgi:peroxiredoxin Q/BCP